MQRNLGLLATAIYLICVGLVGLGLTGLAIVLPFVALLAGILLIVGR